MWRAFDRNQIHFRRGQLHLMVAAPGVGKSVIATSYAVQSETPTLYLSMDTDAHTTCIRLVCAVTRCTLTEAEQGLLTGQHWALGALRAVPHLRYAFTSSPDSTEIGERVLAYGEAMGQYPSLIVVDNLSNIAFDGSDEFGSQRQLMHELQSLAGRTKAAVLVLHHAVGQFEDGQAIVPMSGVSGKVTKYPAMVLTACRWGGGSGTTSVSVVKNRYGPADPAGFGVRCLLSTDFERVQVTESS